MNTTKKNTLSIKTNFIHISVLPLWIQLVSYREPGNTGQNIASDKNMWIKTEEAHGPLKLRGAILRQIRSCFEHCSKGGGQTHVQKICCKFCMILKAFWQHKIDIKRLFKGRNVSIGG